MKNTKEKNNGNEAISAKLRYSVSKSSFFKRLAVMLLGIAIVLTLISSWGFWHEPDMMFIYLQILLPVVSCILFIVIVNHMGEKGFTLTFIPVLCAAVYIIVTETDKAALMHSILTIALCIVVALSYVLTVFGAIGSKWMMLPITLLPLAYRIGVEDLYMFTKDGFSLDSAFLRELAILCMMLALLLMTFAMKKRDFSSKEKPIEDLLVELEDTDAAELAKADTIPPETFAVPGIADADTVVISPSGESHE